MWNFFGEVIDRKTLIVKICGTGLIVLGLCRFDSETVRTATNVGYVINYNQLS